FRLSARVLLPAATPSRALRAALPISVARGQYAQRVSRQTGKTGAIVGIRRQGAFVHIHKRVMPGGNRVCKCCAFLQPYIEIQRPDRKSTRLNSTHVTTSYAVYCSTTK